MHHGRRQRLRRPLVARKRHTLPTSGWARAYSGVNLDSFLRKITFQELTKDGLEGLADTITTLAEAEGLRAHANAVNIRLRHD